jgi:hypothetical protein
MIKAVEVVSPVSKPVTAKPGSSLLGVPFFVSNDAPPAVKIAPWSSGCSDLLTA